MAAETIASRKKCKAPRKASRAASSAATAARGRCGGNCYGRPWLSSTASVRSRRRPSRRAATIAFASNPQGLQWPHLTVSRTASARARGSGARKSRRHWPLRQPPGLSSSSPTSPGTALRSRPPTPIPTLSRDGAPVLQAGARSHCPDVSCNEARRVPSLRHSGPPRSRARRVILPDPELFPKWRWRVVLKELAHLHAVLEADKIFNLPSPASRPHRRNAGYEELVRHPGASANACISRFIRASPISPSSCCHPPFSTMAEGLLALTGPIPACGANRAHRRRGHKKPEKKKEKRPR